MLRLTVECGLNSFSHNFSSVRSAKHGKTVVVTLQNKDSKENMMPFDLATETTEELYEWYQVAWDITQREENMVFVVIIMLEFRNRLLVLL